MTHNGRLQMKTVIALAFLVLLIACKDSEVAQFESLGSRHKITLYGATGTIVGQWESTGNVSNEANSDGWYFRDAKTGKLIEIAGTMIVEQE
jgi:hypothetical protein